MGRRIRNQEEAKQVMHWLKDLTHGENLEDAIILGFHRTQVSEQQPLEELRDIYLMHIQGHVNPHVCQVWGDRAIFLQAIEGIVKSDINQMYALA